MPATIRPRRSVLFMPGANSRALAKSRELPADGLIFDLEDAVAPDAKAAARTAVAAAAGDGGYGGRELVLRVTRSTARGALTISRRRRRCRSTPCCCPRSRALRGSPRPWPDCRGGSRSGA